MFGRCEHGFFNGGQCHIADEKYGLSIKQGSKWFKIVERTGMCPICEKAVSGHKTWVKIQETLGPSI